MRRHHMRKIRELLRLRFEQGCSHREIAAALGISKGSVHSALHRAEALGLSWELALALGDVELEHKLYPSTREQLPRARFPIDFSLIDRELRRRRGVTLMLLWLEYCDLAEADAQRRLPYQYSQFCDH